MRELELEEVAVKQSGLEGEAGEAGEVTLPLAEFTLVISLL